MRVKPTLDFKLLGTDIKLYKNKIYDAMWATNIPFWEEKGKIFVGEILLKKEDYIIIEK